MNKNFLNEMNFESVMRYSKPPLITVTGLPGSGKTTICRKLSKELGIYLLSNDYVRNYLKTETSYQREEREKRVKLINMLRLLKLLSNRIPFILDANVSNLKMLKEYKMIASILKYEQISILTSSNNHLKNIERISYRTLDFNARIEGVLGDDCLYDTSYEETIYYEVLDRKPILLGTRNVDYTLNNEGSYEEFTKQINRVSEEIKRRIL